MGITIGTNVWMPPGQTIPRMHPNLTNTQRESLVFAPSPRLTFSSLSREPLRPYYYIFPQWPKAPPVIAIGSELLDNQSGASEGPAPLGRAKEQSQTYVHLLGGLIDLDVEGWYVIHAPGKGRGRRGGRRNMIADGASGGAH